MSQEFPVLFTIDGSNRHEVILVSSGLSLNDLSSKIEGIAKESPNTQEFMAKYRSNKGGAQKVEEIKVLWASEGRDQRIFPKSTILTAENAKATLALMQLSGGKDVIDVKLSAEEQNLPDRTK